jgi:TPR repeat protein
MADVAHNTPGPASPKPGDVALQQTSRADSPDKGKLRVFISYSRDDLEFADQLNAALELCGFECVIDRHGISGGEDWKRRLGNLITETDTVVFVLSPNSARSEVCAWEVEEAGRLSKRILPVICRPLEGESPPPRLRDLNYILFHADSKTPGSGFGTGLTKLVAALNTDFEWLREHTRYLQRATEWDRGGRPANRLLSGNDIAEAKAWAARRPKNAPELTALHLDFIRASEEEAVSRSSAQRKQLEAMAEAQTEREKALHQAEEAQRKRATMARIRNIALVAVSILALLAGLLGWRFKQQRQAAEEQRAAAEVQRAIAEEQKAAAEKQRAIAEEQREQADRILTGATTIIVKLQTQMDVETRKEVFEVFQTGAHRGDSNSMLNLGVAYSFGHLGVERDYAKAREWFEKAADKGDQRAMVRLGLLYRDGEGVARDYAKAREWFEKAANKGEPLAMDSLGSLYANGNGVARDYDKAREWFEKAANKGEPFAMTELGELYRDGEGVARDYAKAREWFEKAANKGEPFAMNNLGLLYREGHGEARDYAKACEWFEKAAKKGNDSAMLNFGICYHTGHGMARDYAKAREWYEKAAEKGNDGAMINLGNLYHNGQGVAQDYAKAREWFEKAAEKGNDSAMVNLGILYRNGRGMARDYAKAREWFEKAAAKGDAFAKAQLEQLRVDRSRSGARSP